MNQNKEDASWIMANIFWEYQLLLQFIYYIGDVVWGFNIFDRLCKKEKETEHKINARRKSDMVMLQSVEFADSINVAELYDDLCKGGIQGIKSIKKLEIDIGWRWNFMEKGTLH